METLFQDLLGYLGTFRISATLFMELSLQHGAGQTRCDSDRLRSWARCPHQTGAPSLLGLSFPSKCLLQQGRLPKSSFATVLNISAASIMKNRTWTARLRQAEAACVQAQCVLKACVCKCVHTCLIEIDNIYVWCLYIQ